MPVHVDDRLGKAPVAAPPLLLLFAPLALLSYQHRAVGGHQSNQGEPS
jgi:hypothetical protein